MRNIWNMPDKKKKTCYTSQSFPLAFITQCIQSTQLLIRACVFPFDTCWLIESIRLSLFISFSRDWGLTSVTSGTDQAWREHHSLAWQDCIWFSGSGRFAWRKHHLCCLCSPVSLAKKGEWKKKRGAACFLVTRWPGNTGACWSKQNADACGVGKGMWREEEQGRWRHGGITSSLPTRQPWVLLLCWSECNRPGFFSLTTGACEHTSSPPWERRLSWQSQCLFLSFFSPLCYRPFLFFIYVSVSSCVLISVLFVLPVFASFFLSHCM